MTAKTSNDIELGDKVRDSISQFEGIAVSIVHYLTNCDQVGIKPQGVKKDGDGTFDTLFFDAPYVDIVEKGVIKNRIPDRKSGAMKAPGKLG